MNVNWCTMRKGRERSNCDCILLFCEIVNMYYEIKMENTPQPPTPQKNIFFVKLGLFVELGKNIFFGIGNGAEIWPQNLVIKSLFGSLAKLT